MNVYIKNMDEQAYKEARKLAIDSGENVGKVFAEGIILLKKKYKHKTKKTNLKELLGFFGKNEELARQQQKELLEARRNSIELGKEREELHERLRHKRPD